MFHKIAFLLLIVLGVSAGSDCQGNLPAGLSVVDVGCGTKVAPPGFGVELIVPCRFQPNNEFSTPAGFELFTQAFITESRDGTNILVWVAPPGVGGSGLSEEFNDFTATGTFTSAFGVELLTFENVNETQNIRQFLAGVDLPDGNALLIAVTGFTWDAAENQNSASTVFRSVKMTQ